MSDNLNITRMATTPTPTQGTNLLNTALGEIDGFLSGAGEAFTAVYDSDGDAAILTSDLDGLGGVILPDAGSGATDFDVNFESGTERLAIIVLNNSGVTATLQFSGQYNPPTLPTGQVALVTLVGDVAYAIIFTGG